MATLQEVQAEIAALKTHVATEAGEVKTVVTDLQKQIADLQAQIAAGSPVTAADLDALIAQLKDAETSVDAIITPPVQP